MADKHPVQILVDEQDYQAFNILVDYYYRKSPGYILGELLVKKLRELQRKAVADIQQGIVIPGYDPE